MKLTNINHHDYGGIKFDVLTLLVPSCQAGSFFQEFPCSFHPGTCSRRRQVPEMAEGDRGLRI